MAPARRPGDHAARLARQGRYESERGRWSLTAPAPESSDGTPGRDTPGEEVASGEPKTDADRDKIMRIVEPVIVRPLLAEWEIEKENGARPVRRRRRTGPRPRSLPAGRFTQPWKGPAARASIRNPAPSPDGKRPIAGG